MPEWTFFSSHGLVLRFIACHPRTTAREMAAAIGITKRASQKIIADLLETGYIDEKREGRRNRYRVNPDLALRHPTHSETAVGCLLEVLGWRRRRTKVGPGQHPSLFPTPTLPGSMPRRNARHVHADVPAYGALS